MKIYIAGKITGLEEYKRYFKWAEKMLKEEGHCIMNPAKLGNGFDYEEYMHVCFAMIDVCDCVFLLSNWQGSEGAKREREYAIANCKLIVEGRL